MQRRHAEPERGDSSTGIEVYGSGIDMDDNTSIAALEILIGCPFEREALPHESS
jgi:hypothetical protein